MKHILHTWLLVVLAGFLAGCGSGNISEHEVGAFIGVATQNYSSLPEQAMRAQVENPQNPTFKLGASEVRFGTPVFSDKMLAIGWGNPTKPTPRADVTDFENRPLYVIVTYRPEEYFPPPGWALVLNPQEYLILIEGSDSPLAPTNWEIARDSTIRTNVSPLPDCYFSVEARLFALGSGCTFWLFYDIKMGDVPRFTLMPAPIYAGDVLYGFPHIDYERGTYTGLVYPTW